MSDADAEFESESEMSESEMSESGAAPSSLAVGVTSRTASAERCAPNAATTSSSHGSRAAGSEGGGHANDSDARSAHPGETRARTSVAVIAAAAAAASFRVTIAAASGERSAPPPDEDARDAAMTRVAVASFASSFVGSAALAETASTNAASNAGRAPSRRHDPIGASFVNAPVRRTCPRVFRGWRRARVFARRRLRPAPRARRASRPTSQAPRAITPPTLRVAAASVAGSNPASVVFEDRLVSRHLAASARASPPGRHAAPCASTKDAMRVACARSNEDDAAVVAANRGAANFAPTQPVDDASETPLAPFLARAAARSASWNARARAAPGGSTLAPRSSSRVTVAISAAARASPRLLRRRRRLRLRLERRQHLAQRIPRRRGRRSGRRVRVHARERLGRPPFRHDCPREPFAETLRAENVLVASRDDDAVQKPLARRAEKRGGVRGA